MNGTSAAAWAAVATAGAALTKQVYDIMRGRKKEKTQVQQALDQQPEIKRQLQLGNVEVVTELLNRQILRQADQLDRAYNRIDHLEQSAEKSANREEALEAEVEGYQRVISQCDAKLEKISAFLEGLGYDPETLKKE